jgi:hypothetical protein
MCSKVVLGGVKNAGERDGCAPPIPGHTLILGWAFVRARISNDFFRIEKFHGDRQVLWYDRLASVSQKKRMGFVRPTNPKQHAKGITVMRAAERESN